MGRHSQRGRCFLQPGRGGPRGPYRRLGPRLFLTRRGSRLFPGEAQGFISRGRFSGAPDLFPSSHPAGLSPSSYPRASCLSAASPVTLFFPPLFLSQRRPSLFKFPRSPFPPWGPPAGALRAIAGGDAPVLSLTHLAPFGPLSRAASRSCAARALLGAASARRCPPSPRPFLPSSPSKGGVGPSQPSRGVQRGRSRQSFLLSAAPHRCPLPPPRL